MRWHAVALSCHDSWYHVTLCVRGGHGTHATAVQSDQRRITASRRAWRETIQSTMSPLEPTQKAGAARKSCAR